MTDHQALLVTIQINLLRIDGHYQDAEAMRRRVTASAMANSEVTSPEHASIRLLIGTWEHIAMFVRDFSPGQKRRFFKCHPVLLVWGFLYPAVRIIRGSGLVAPNFAATLEGLAGEYEAWTKTADGKEFRTEAQQYVCALFA